MATHRAAKESTTLVLQVHIQDAAQKFYAKGAYTQVQWLDKLINYTFDRRLAAQ